jgi:hypothetical protein
MPCALFEYVDKGRFTARDYLLSRSRLLGANGSAALLTVFPRNDPGSLVALKWFIDRATHRIVLFCIESVVQDRGRRHCGFPCPSWI